MSVVVAPAPSTLLVMSAANLAETPRKGQRRMSTLVGHKNLLFEQDGKIPSVNDQLPPKTKIICTIGPNTKSQESLEALSRAGMNVVRMNFSHGDHEYHGGVIHNIRQVCHDTRRVCGVMLDTKGPEIRTWKLADGKDVKLVSGQTFTLTTDLSVVGDATKVAVQYTNLPRVLAVGNRILIDDGLIAMTVTAVDVVGGGTGGDGANAGDGSLNEGDFGGTVTVTVDNNGVLGERKGVNLPGVAVDLPAVTPKDVEDLLFGVEQGVDFIAASFIRNAAAVIEIRRVLGDKGKNIKIISKIENQQGLDNFEEILAVTDGIMVARGDLGVEIPLEQVALAQKMMIRKCNAAGKFVITATQMLESMTFNPSPTRAEASDVANAVIDGTDAVMLSGETAKGQYPVEAVTMMASICREAEAATNYTSNFRQQRQSDTSIAKTFIIPSTGEAIASAAVVACLDIRAKLVVVLTESGNTARLVAKYRPHTHVFTITPSAQTARQCLVSFGLFPLLVSSMIGSDSLVDRAIETAKRMGVCKSGDLVVVACGQHEGRSGSTNAIRVITVDADVM